MKNYIINALGTLSLFNFSVVFRGLNDAFNTESSWISEEANEIMKNPEDRKKVEDAIEDLKQGKDVEPLELSNGKVINIGID